MTISNVLSRPAVPLPLWRGVERRLRDLPGGSIAQRRGHIEYVEAAQPSSLLLWCGI